MIARILSYLLHHANRETKSDQFYKIKDKILSRYGTVIGHDVQFIEGKICHSCNGKGLHYRCNRYGYVYDTADCYHCAGGWYKRPTWVLLQRIQFGRYIFHKPIQRERRFKDNPFTKEAGWNVTEGVITGYIDHTRTKFGKDALVILYLLYDWKGYWARWHMAIGHGWRCGRWWLRPRSWPNNIAHIIRYGRKSIPFRRKDNYIPPPVSQFIHSGQPDDLPF